MSGLEILLAIESSKTTISCETYPICDRHELDFNNDEFCPSIKTFPLVGLRISVNKS